MLYLNLFLAGACVVLSPLIAETTNSKLGYVDLQRALQTVEAGKKAKSTIENEMKAHQMEFNKLQEKLRKEYDQFQKKAAILSDTAKMTKAAELQKQEAELVQRMRETEGKLRQREQELTQPILEEFREIIKEKGKTGNYGMIVEKGAVLYSEPEANLTEYVIDRFNLRKAKKSSLPKSQ